MAADEAIEAIYMAAREGDAVSVARMLDEDPGLLPSGWKNHTLLTTAAWNGHVDVMRLLLERGAEINQANAHGSTALICAVSWAHEEIVSFLLTRGADLSRKGSQGQTALMHASMDGNVAMVRLLLRSMGGGGLDERDEDGRTALSYACFEGHADVVRALLLAGADHTIAGNRGTTPLQAAEEERNHECVALLQWWEDELQRAYLLHKARTLHEDTATRQQAPAAPVPAYLSARVQGGKRLPHVHIQASGGSGGRRTRGAAETGGQEKEEEVCAMVGFVVKDLAAELYIELLAGFHQ